MNRKQIIAELRRSACEDADPYIDAHFIAWDIANGFAFDHEHFARTRDLHIRTFYLLVACALEDEQ